MSAQAHRGLVVVHASGGSGEGHVVLAGGGAADCLNAPECGVGLAETQFQVSPPSVAVTALAGSALAIQTWLDELAWKSALAKARRPSGNWISTSTHWAP